MNLDDVRRSIDEARRDFREALGDARALWETPAGGSGSWAPRQVAEHVLGAELGYAGAVTSALGLERPPWQTFALESAEEASLAQARVAEASRSIMSLIRDDDLTRLTPSDATIAEVLEKAADHLREHAAQIRASARQ